ncbi:hypothetical protein BDQ17DRAFT_1343524 [Cyathus striatus]|nr:hypothetical protein BDQ17DRAFT_1343524 [Cyathus striatus]
MADLPPGAVQLSLSELENTFGVLFIGYILAIIAYGFTFFQTYIYYSRYPNDHRVIKTTVCLLLDTATSALSELYYYLIFLFPYTEGLYNATKCLQAEIGLSVIAVFTVQMYYSFRIWTCHKQALPLTSAISFLSTAAFAMTTFTLMHVIRSKNRAFEKLSSVHMKGVIAAGQGCAFLSGLLIFVALCIYSRRASPSKATGISALYDKFVMYTMDRCLLATIVQLGFFITFVVAPKKVLWMPFHLVSSKLFVNSLFSILNSREVHYGRGINEEETTSRRAAPTFAPGRTGTGGIRFGSGDVKSGVGSDVDAFRSTSDHAFTGSKGVYEEDVSAHWGQH